MNKMILLAAVISMAAPSAFASKARLAALSDSQHLVDTQTIFRNPGDLGLLGDFATFEFGTTAGSNSQDYRNSATPADKTAEGGFVRSNGDAKWGFYLGHKSDTVARTRLVGTALGAATLPEQNPLELFYGMKGDLNWGASVFYSNSDKKTTGDKQNSAGLRFGARTTVWDAYINVGIGADAKNSDGREVKNDLGAKIGGGYYFDNLYVYGNYGMQNATINTAAAEVGKLEGSELNVGILDTKKLDGADFFYGISYGMYHLKNKDGNGGPTIDNSYFPVLVGIEADAASWLTVRASLQQNVLIGGHKYDNGTGTGTDMDTWNNSTVVAAGLGAKWNKFIFDGTLQAAANGGSVGFDGNNFLGTGSITYMF
jgi:hypothetical protein